MKSLAAVGIFCLFVSPWSLAQGSKQPLPPVLASHISKLMTIPNAIDSDRDGELSISEVMAAPRQLARLDKNRDGALDAKEMGAYEAQLPLIRAHNITNLIDADGNVHISAEEIKNASSALKHLDFNGDWHISKKELGFNKNPKFSVFSNKPMPYPIWKKFRGYTTKLEGPVVPGQDKRAYGGYILVHDAGDFGLVQQSDETYLLDEIGNKAHEWKHNGHSPEASVAYLLANGQLLRTYSKYHWIRDKHFPVGATSSIELVAWDGTVLWDFTMSVPEKYSFHHDVEYMPNGHILAIRYNAFTLEEAKAMGWNPSLGQKSIYKVKNNKDKKAMLWMSNLVELKPNLSDGSTEIVWQWNSWDHLVQNKYSDKLNYGDITNPSKLHINYLNLDKDVPFNMGQMFHLNTVDYHPELDLIMLSSATYGELWIIDHSTTTTEAAGGAGGRHNKGGDLLYRWGNDEAYGKGTRDDSYLYWQHDTQWIEDGLPGAGNILIFNNGNRRTLDDKYIRKQDALGFTNSYSNLLEIKLPMNKRGQFNRRQSPEIVWSWKNPDEADYYSPFMSGLQRLPNGNTIFNSAYDKQITEVTVEGEKVLDFSLEGWGRLYRVYKYGPEYSGLAFKVGESKGLLKTNKNI